MSIESEHIFAFIRREVPPPLFTKLSENTDLRRNLRMAEEDADDLLAKFFQEFSVALGDFEFTRYFPSEGLMLFGRKRSAPAPLTLGMMLQAARNGIWDTATIQPNQEIR
ncbi:MAG: DUF1493 family protein [Burkholderiaceae bacterium]|jgi:hypothetical protein|nr:DUF1493 family protein [Burkholderiaceae bacterium]